MQIMPILFSLCYNSSLVTRKVISLTATKFKFQKLGVCCKFPGGASVSHYWFNQCLVLKRSFLNRDWTLISVLKALASIISMWNFHVILLSEITPKYFIWFTKGMFHLFNIRWASFGLCLWQKCVFIEFYVPSLTPHLHWIETAL
jgi:hypothetical protein